MKRFACRIMVIVFLLFLFPSASFADFDFADDRFQGVFTTENLDKIIEEYELYDSWYWTTPPRVPQTFHGLEDTPGWTDTASKMGRTLHVKNYYGCRWMANHVLERYPNAYGTYGECFGFAQFIGYLLSGEYNPHKNWQIFYNLKSSGGLRVGDILRTEFTARGKKYNHSAIVYSVDDEEILFMQVSGSLYNRISVGVGFLYGYDTAPTTYEEILKVPNIKICRSQLNTAPPDSEPLTTDNETTNH